MATAPMTLGTVMLGEASQSQKRRILCDSAEMRSAEQMRRDRRGKGRCGGRGETGTGSWRWTGAECQSGTRRKFSGCMVATSALQCESP